MNTVLDILQYLIMIARWIIIAQIILSLLLAFNVVNRHNNFVDSIARALDTITEPIYRPIRRILPDTGQIDFAPMVVLVLLVVLNIIIVNQYQPVSYSM